MDSNQHHTTPEFTVPKDGGGRPGVDPYGKELAFRPNDKVCIRAVGSQSKQGPFVVCSVTGGYKLQNDQGQYVEGGKLFEEKDLEFYNPFA